MKQREEIREFIVDAFLFGDDQNLRDDTRFFEQGIVDSTGVLELISFLESRYNIVVKDEELIPDNLDSLERVCRFVEMKLRPSVARTAVAGAVAYGAGAAGM